MTIQLIIMTEYSFNYIMPDPVEFYDTCRKIQPTEEKEKIGI